MGGVMAEEEELDVADDNMLKKPCRACPYRRESARGWLGAATPEEFIGTTFGEAVLHVGGQLVTVPAGAEMPMPCHLSIDYEDPDWAEKWEKGWDTGKGTGSLCAGAAIMFANRVKMPKHLRLPSREPDRENIFTQPSEFIRHHREGAVHSWSDDDDVG